METLLTEKKALQEKVIKTLEQQGFLVNDVIRPSNYSKEIYRLLQSKARLNQLSNHRNLIRDYLPIVKQFSISGDQIQPEKISLKLIEIKKNSVEEKIFRWWNFVWWSIPYQHPYGRQIRLLLWDEFHNSPFGLIYLQSPVLKMSVRDKYLEIPKDELDIWVNRSMNAQRVGALPPYNQLLGGKMVALAITSNEVRAFYNNKYSDSTTILKKRKIDPDLIFITTTSAFGKSSMYDRLKFKQETVALSLGYTKGVGSFHLPDNIYQDMLKYLAKNGFSIDRKYGDGPSKKVKLITVCLRILGLQGLEFHGLRREFFIFPLVRNLREIIHENEKPVFFDRPLEELEHFWKNRWMLNRSKRINQWKEFRKDLFFEKIEREVSNLNG